MEENGVKRASRIYSVEAKVRMASYEVGDILMEEELTLDNRRELLDIFRKLVVLREKVESYLERKNRE